MNNTDIVRQSLKRRYRKERRFRAYGMIAVATGFLFLGFLLTDIVTKAVPAFSLTELRLDIPMDRESLGLAKDAEISEESLRALLYSQIIKKSLRSLFPDIRKRKQKKLLYKLISSGAEFDLRDRLVAHPEWIDGPPQSLWLTADDDVDTWYKLDTQVSRIKPLQAELIQALEKQDRIRTAFNSHFFTRSDSREPEMAGIRGALAGSFWTLLVTFVITLPIGVAAALYLEEFAPQNRLTDFIEVNINNLAAVPSIVFGLLGLAIFINFFGMPRSAPLVGGLVLTLMTLPTIIISARAAIKSIPPSIKEAAYGLGASKMQVVFHHVLPLSMPGILTGSIIGMAQALGETAPLLMIGMVAFIVEIPEGVLDSATVLPVQIYLWSDSPERAFSALTAATILVLLGFLAAMNALAIFLRKHFERRW